MKSLVLAEKPSVGRDIARVLGSTKKGKGYFEGDQYIVTWALGHLVTLADPETYDQKYKTWNLNDLPMLPNDMKLTVIRNSGSQFNAVKSQLKRKDVSEIIIATDAGREGELVARWIIEKANVNKPMKRLWISSITDKAIKEGFKNLKPAKNYENLFQAAVARSEADWYIGLNASRALTTKYNAQLNCGRVQTPVVQIIAQREEEIHQFKPKTFYGAEAATDHSLKLIWQDAQSNDTKTFDQQKIQQVVKHTEGKNAVVTDVVKKPKKTFSPALYDLTELQRDAYQAFGYSAKETLNIMQTLYEQYKVLTYPRTDSRYLTSDIVPTLKDRIKVSAHGEYKAIAKTLLNQPIKAQGSFVNDQKVSDHHAIIPTEQVVPLQKLSAKERQIYNLVVKRFFAVLLPAHEYEQFTLTATIGSERFTAKGKTVSKMGWKEATMSADVKEDSSGKSLSSIKVGDTLNVSYVNETTGQTKAPAHFNEATLLTAMENPGQYMGHKDKALTQTLKATGGLGTVATRADIIDKLFKSFLIEKKGNNIHVTSKGKQLLELVPADLRSPELTAEWEQKLEAIAKGNLKKEQFVDDIKTFTKELVTEIKQTDGKFRHENLSTKTCPDCGKPMLEVNGKKGKMLVCQDRECGYRKNVSRQSNARCPNCMKKMSLSGEGDGQIFTCSCGYREKLSAFKKRRDQSGSGKADKRTVQKYLKKQKQEEPEDNGLFDALKGLKFED